MASLARLKAADPAVAERAEVFIGGLELANAYSELTDPAEQAGASAWPWRRYAGKGSRSRPAGALPGGLPHLPACGGVALGVDRLVMLFCDAASIDEVMAFTEDTA